MAKGNQLPMPALDSRNSSHNGPAPPVLVSEVQSSTTGRYEDVKISPIRDFVPDEEARSNMEDSANADSSNKTERTATEDLNIVDWNGDDDPEHPYNWPSWQLVINCIMISLASFITPLGSTIFAPAVPQVLSEFNVHSSELATFVVSVDVLGFAFGPLLFAPMSELYGRVKIYHVCNAGFVVSTILCGAAPDMSSLVVFRLFSGIFGACFGTIGGGCIADMVRQERRAVVMAMCGAGNLLGPIVGPVLGGFVNASWGWRWTQYIVAIAAGGPAILILFTFRECYHPVLLERRAARLRLETGNLSLKSKYDLGLSPTDLLKRSIIRPLKLLARQPVVTISALFIGISYAVLFVMFTSITSVFDEYYNFSTSAVGLAFMGLGVGSVIGVAIYSITTNRYLKRKKSAASSVVSGFDTSTGPDGGSTIPATQSQGMQPEHRLLLLPVGSVMLPIGLLLYGWTVQYHVHWIAPIMATSLIAVGNVIVYMALQMFLVDSFTIFAASALAAMTVVRSLAAALLPLSGLALYDRLGVGWGNTLLASINMLFVPVAWLIKKHGAFLISRFKIKNL